MSLSKYEAGGAAQETRFKGSFRAQAQMQIAKSKKIVKRRCSRNIQRLPGKANCPPGYHHFIEHGTEGEWTFRFAHGIRLQFADILDKYYARVIRTMRNVPNRSRSVMNRVMPSRAWAIK